MSLIEVPTLFLISQDALQGRTTKIRNQPGTLLWTVRPPACILSWRAVAGNKQISLTAGPRIMLYFLRVFWRSLSEWRKKCKDHSPILKIFPATAKSRFLREGKKKKKKKKRRKFICMTRNTNYFWKQGNFI